MNFFTDSGVGNPKYLNKKPIAVHNARWHTMMARSNDVYQRTATPSQEHILMTQFIVQPYAATVFDIYQKPHVRHGSFHYFNYAKRCIESLGIESEVWTEVVKPCFLRNGYW